MKKRIFIMLVAVMMLLGALAMGVSAEEPADVYVATTGLDTNAGTADAPVLSLNKALELVANGGTVHIVDSYTAPSGFVWDNHNKDVTITGGKLDLSAGYMESTDGGAAFYYYAQGDAVTYDNLELVLADDMYYFANGFRLQINENVTVSGKDLQLYGGGFKQAVASTNMKLLGGSYLCDNGYASIYGGSYKADVNGDVNLYVGKVNSDYAASHYGKTRLYGGCYNYSGNSHVKGDVNLTIAGGNIDRIVAVSHTACIVTGNVNVLMTGGSTYSLIGGSGGEGNVQGDIRLTMTGGTVAQLFGANEGGSYTGNVTVKLQGGTITRRFLGGCYNNFEGVFDTQNHVTGNIDVFLYEGMNFAWNTNEADCGFYAHSRYNPQFPDEVSNLYYMSAAAKAKHENNLGSKNSGMTWVMGEATAVADNICVVPTQVEKWNVVLGDDIGANFYVNVPAEYTGASVQVTVAGKTVSHAVSGLEADEQGLYLIPVRVAAAHMTEPIALQLVADGVEAEAVSYTIAQYADTIMNGEYSDETKALVAHMLNYGAAAQVYFDVNTNVPANKDHKLDYTAQFPDGYADVAIDGQISGMQVYAATLVLKNQVAVRYYFQTSTVEGVAFTANGKSYSAMKSGDLYYVEVPGINPYEYADSIVLSAVKGEETLEVSYSPMHYMVRKSANGSDKLKALLNAMYGYHEAALIYLDNRTAYIELPQVTGAAVTADQASCIEGGTITLTVKPEPYYHLTSLTVKKDGEVFTSFETAEEGGTYSFVTGAAGVYTVEAALVQDHMVSAPNTEYVLRSAAIKYTEGSAFVERGDTTGVNADDPMIDTLLTQAPGQFNKSGEEWLWIAYKINAPTDGTYSLGLTVNDARDAKFKMPMVINHEVYTLNFTAKKQTVTTDVALPAGEHIVTVFWPMPATASEALAEDWQNYIWANVQTLVVDYQLSVCAAPTAAEVETYMVPNTKVAAIDGNTVLWSAAMGDNGNGYLEFNSRDAVKVDLPYIDSLFENARGQFNKSGEEWGWIAYKVTAPADGTYTLTLQMQGCRNAPYYMPLYVNSQTYSLYYGATGRQVASAEVTLTSGEHTVVIFMPMPVNAAGSTGENWVDYPWANPESITVDGLLSVSKPTTEEVEACFPADPVINATDAANILWSAAVKHTEGAAFLERGATTGLYADAPQIDNLLDVAPGKFNASGTEWPWMSYKISVPADGTYKLGVTTNSAKWDSFKLPMVVNHQVYTLSYTAKAQTQTVEVTLPAGEHIVTVFWPMPANESEVYVDAAWNTYQWANIASVTVDYRLTASLPTAQEVETYMVPNTIIAAIDAETVLWSAAMGDNGNGYLEFNSRDAVKADLPYIDSLFENACGQFNQSGEEWGWIAYKVTAPADGTYTLTLQNQACRVAPYYMPLYVNEEIYTLSYGTAGNEAASVEVTLPAGEHTVVIFMPMPKNAASSIGEAWQDYPWCNPQTLTVDGLLSVSKPTVEEVEACFAMETYSAPNTSYILRSAAVKYTEGNAYVERGSTTGVHEDTPRFDTLLDLAPGNFNESGKEWLWIAYKINIPTDGTYTLGLTTAGSKYASYKMPMVVNGQVYTLSFTEKSQTVTTEVALTAGEHIVTVFWPMPENESKVDASNANNYIWCNVKDVVVDHSLTITAPTAAEVEACFPVEEEGGLENGGVLTDDYTYGEIS